MALTRDSTFAALLKWYRARARLSQEDLAERSGVSARAISDLERGLKQRPRAATIGLLAEALGLSEQERAGFAGAASGAPSPEVAHPVSEHNLPPQLTSFVGRESHIGILTRWLRKPDIRLITLIGPGGAGKTRLALRVAEETVGEFADGVCFVNLAAVLDPKLVVQEIAQALGVRETSGVDTAQSLEAYLRDRRILLLLDNFEQIVGAAPLLVRLLVACPGLRLLVTSRVLLRVSPEHAYPVPPLVLPSSDASGEADSLSCPESVRLFIARAKAVRPGFRLTEENRAAVAEICRTLEGLPLAIELAAARLRLMSPQAVLSRLDNRLALLAGGAHDLPMRHQTMKATLDWSYDLLRRRDQGLLRTLSVFAGGFDVEAVEAVCIPEHGEDVLESLSLLLDSSLLRQDEKPDGRIRFETLATVREYALLKLVENGEEESVCLKHAQYYIGLVEAAQREMHGKGQTEWLLRLDEEAENRHGALRWALDVGRLDLAMRGAAGLKDYWLLRGRLSEGRMGLGRVLTAHDVAGMGQLASVRARALLAVGVLARAQGDLDAAEGFVTESLVLARSEGGPAEVAAVLHGLGTVAQARGDHQSAAGAYAEALDLYRGLDDVQGESAVLSDLGTLSRGLGDWTHAVALHEESLRLRRRLGGQWAIAHSLRNLALVAHLAGDYGRSEELLRESIGLFRELGDRLAVADSLNDLGLLPHVRQDSRLASMLFEEARAVYHDLGVEKGVAWSLNNLGLLAFDQGNYEAAKVLHEESWRLRGEHGAVGAASISQYDLGNALQELGEHHRAFDAYRAAMRGLREVGDKALMVFCIEGLARLALLYEQRTQAVRLLAAADAARVTLRCPLPPPDAPGYRSALASARAILGEDAFASAWERGSLLNLDEAVHEDLSL